MAWTCSASTNKGLVANLLKTGLVKTPQVADAMQRIDRGYFTAEAAAQWACENIRGQAGPQEPCRNAYADAPTAIGYDVTCSAPHMHAYALETLLSHVTSNTSEQQHNKRILDVGSGSGYLTACLAALAGPSAKVIGIEHEPALVQRSKEAIERSTIGESALNAGWISNGRVVIHEGDGRLGWKEEAPFDVIHVGAAAPVLPHHLVDQLRAPGRLLVPVGTSDQFILLVDKSENGDITQTTTIGVRYVPLTDSARIPISYSKAAKGYWTCIDSLGQLAVISDARQAQKPRKRMRHLQK